MGKPRWDDKGSCALVRNIVLPNEPPFSSVLSLAQRVLPFTLPSGKTPRKAVSPVSGQLREAFKDSLSQLFLV